MIDDKFLRQLDPRLHVIILQAETRSDAGCLATVLRVINNTASARRDASWLHFERTVSKRIREHVRKLHDAYVEVEAEVTAHNNEFDGWLKKVREADRSRNENDRSNEQSQT